MKLEVGKKYLTRDGNHIITITDTANRLYKFVGQLDGFLESWTKSGRYDINEDEHDWDLISENADNEKETPIP